MSCTSPIAKSWLQSNLVGVSVQTQRVRTNLGPHSQELLRAGCIPEMLCAYWEERVEREATKELSGEGCKWLSFLARRKGVGAGGGEGRCGEKRGVFWAALANLLTVESDVEIKLLPVFLGMEEEKEKPKLEWDLNRNAKAGLSYHRRCVTPGHWQCTRGSFQESSRICFHLPPQRGTPFIQKYM